jgi:hypothetical protein
MPQPRLLKLHCSDSKLVSLMMTLIQMQEEAVEAEVAVVETVEIVVAVEVIAEAVVDNVVAEREENLSLMITSSQAFEPKPPALSL